VRRKITAVMSQGGTCGSDLSKTLKGQHKAGVPPTKARRGPIPFFVRWITLRRDPLCRIRLACKSGRRR
jgi:hypothetical protein